jgi:hypothetical protein
MNNTIKSAVLRRILCMYAAVAASGVAVAQTAPAPAREGEDEPIRLSPFVVSSQDEEGYRS